MLAEPVDGRGGLPPGLLNRLVEDDEQVLPAAQELAARLAAGPTVAYAAIKRRLSIADGGTLADALAAEAQAQTICGAPPTTAPPRWPSSTSRSRSSRATDGSQSPAGSAVAGPVASRAVVLLRILVGLGAQHERLHGQLVAGRGDEGGQLSRAQLLHVGPEPDRLGRGVRLDRQVQADQPGAAQRRRAEPVGQLAVDPGVQRGHRPGDRRLVGQGRLVEAASAVLDCTSPPRVRARAAR